ncbi:hypothetical protein [Bacillus thuringiensis]|uniref:hypothetical protein n=2 Tax=Bacillus thuringiensis TaxID=1428 RepID=UPI003A7FE726
MDIYDYKFSLIRNFNGTELRSYLKTQMTNLDEIYQKASGSNPREKICSLLNEQISKGFNDVQIDKTMFESLVYLDPERCYYLNLNTDLTVDLAWERLEKSKNYSPIIDRKLSKLISKDEELITLRREDERIIFLFKKGEVQLGVGKEKCDFYVPCVLDFKEKHMEIRLNQYKLRNISRVTGIKLKHLIDEMCKFVNDKLFMVLVGNSDESDNTLSVSKSTEAKVHKDLYNLFSIESAKSLKLIKEKVVENEAKQGTKKTEEQLRKNISKYLKKELSISNPEQYVERVMSVKYQDTAQQIRPSVFVANGGYIFGFSFIDRKITRSTNRNEDRKPVYSSPIYWNLKGVVKQYEEISELAVYWKFNKKDFHKPFDGKTPKNDLSFVEVGFKEIHGVLEIHYYVNYDETGILSSFIKGRRIKENYVIQKIKGFIQSK